MKGRRRTRRSAAVIALGWTICPPAFAHDPTAAALEELVVTARKRVERLQEVPLAISTSNGGDLEARSIRQPSDLTRLVPSLVVATGGNGSVNNAAIILRGQGPTDVALTLSQPVSLHEDGVNIPHPIGANGAFFDLERVEVLKGPQGTLYGRNTTGGAVNIITRSPDFAGLHGYLLGEIGSYSGRRYGGALNAPLAKDTLSARLAYLRWERKGYGRSRTTGQRLGGDHDDEAFRLSLRLAPAGPLTVEVKYARYTATRNGSLVTARYFDGNPAGALEAALYADFATNQARLARGQTGDAAALGAAISAGAAAMAPCIGDDLFTSCQGTVTRDGVTVNHGVLDIRWELGEHVRLRSLSGFHSHRSNRVFDLDGLPFQMIEVGAGLGGAQFDLGSAPRPWPLLPYPAVDDQAARQVSQEVNLSGEAWGRLDWLIGAFWGEDRGDGGQRAFATPGLLRVASPVGVRAWGYDTIEATNRTWAVFGQQDIRITDRLSTTLGARYTVERLGQNLAAWSYFTGLGRYLCAAGSMAGQLQENPERCAVASSARFSGTSYLASLNLQARPQVLVYARTSRGFRGGALQAREAEAPPAAPETATDYELGLKGDFFDGRLRANLAAYQTNYRNKQESVLFTNRTGALATILQNAARVRIRGAEAELTFRPVDGLTLFFNGGAIHAVYVSFPGAQTPEGVRDLSGMRLGLPKYKFDLGGRYQAALGPGVLALQADYHAYSRFPQILPATLTPSLRDLAEEFGRGHALVNARIEYSLPDRGVTFSVFGTNLTDERYQFGGSGGPVTSGVYTGLTQEPRMFGVSVRATFGDE